MHVQRYNIGSLFYHWNFKPSFIVLLEAILFDFGRAHICYCVSCIPFLSANKLRILTEFFVDASECACVSLVTKILLSKRSRSRISHCSVSFPTPSLAFPFATHITFGFALYVAQDETLGMNFRLPWRESKA